MLAGKYFKVSQEVVEGSLKNASNLVFSLRGRFNKSSKVEDGFTKVWGIRIKLTKDGNIFFTLPAEKYSPGSAKTEPLIFGRYIITKISLNDRPIAVNCPGRK